VNVGQHSSGSNGDASQQSAQLLVVADGQLNVARHNARALVVARRISGELLNDENESESPHFCCDICFLTRISAVKYSSTAAKYTGAPAPTRSAYLPSRKWRWILKENEQSEIFSLRQKLVETHRPTGNCKPARLERVVDFPVPFLAFPFPPALAAAKTKNKKQKREKRKSTKAFQHAMLTYTSLLFQSLRKTATETPKEIFFFLREKVHPWISHTFFSSSITLTRDSQLEKMVKVRIATLWM
jgi:hypothetical protein